MKKQSLVSNTLTPSKTSTNSMVYNLKIKRGIAWSTRRIELDRERIKYFKPDDNELRFKEKIDDCNLLEKHPEVLKKYYLKIVSKTKSFSEVKISSDDKELLKAFKKDFDSIVNYKNTMSSIQNKTFVIESENKPQRSSTFRTVVDDNQTVHKSVLLDENISTYAKSVCNQDIQTDLASTMNKVETETLINRPVDFLEINQIVSNPLVKSEILVENTENPQEIANVEVPQAAITSVQNNK